MTKQSVPKKYMLILQRRFGGQDAVEFLEDGSAYAISIKPFTDKKTEETRKTNSIIQKNTLAFYDTITNRFKSFDHFITTVGINIYPINYKETTSYIGYLNNGYMFQLPLSFNDPVLVHIAFVADGNKINSNDSVTMNNLIDIIDSIEDLSSDFVAKLALAHENKDKRFNFSRSLIEYIVTYNDTIKEFEKRNLYSSAIGYDLVEDVKDLKKDLLNKIKSYKNFRELYRFRKQYLLEQEKDDIQAAVDDIKNGTNIDDSDEYKKSFEKIKQKDYSYTRGRKKNTQVPGQMSLFELFPQK